MDGGAIHELDRAAEAFKNEGGLGSRYFKLAGVGNFKDRVNQFLAFLAVVWIQETSGVLPEPWGSNCVDTTGENQLTAYAVGESLGGQSESCTVGERVSQTETEVGELDAV